MRLVAPQQSATYNEINCTRTAIPLVSKKHYPAIVQIEYQALLANAQIHEFELTVLDLSIEEHRKKALMFHAIHTSASKPTLLQGKHKAILTSSMKLMPCYSGMLLTIVEFCPTSLPLLAINIFCRHLPKIPSYKI